MNPAALPSFGDSAWLSVTTVTTVGFGDVVPSNASGRVVTAVLALLGISLIPVLTSVVVSVLLAQHRRQDDAARADQSQALLEALAATQPAPRQDRAKAPAAARGLIADPSVTALTDSDLYTRGAETMLAAWEEYARGAADAAVRRLPGVTAGVFPCGPERAFYNNALLERDLGAAERADAVEAMEAAYTAGGVTQFAAWVHESDAPMRGDLEQRGYTLQETTRAMGMALDDIRLPRPEIELAPADWGEYLRASGFPPGLLAGADPARFHVLVAPLEGENVAVALAFDLGSDCGIYNVGTLEHARRRGLGTALTTIALHDARDRGCETASVQSTEMAEGVYAAVGFRDLGRFLEYGPPGAPGAGYHVSGAALRGSPDAGA